MSKDYCGIFLEGVSRVFESSLINAPYDKTVVGTIVEDFQSASGKYIVSYQGTNYSASPRDSGAIYAKNDTVYLVKQANLDQYMILGKKITQADLAVQVVNPYTKYARLLDYKPVSETISAVDNKYTFPTWQINTNEEYDTITISGGFKTVDVKSYRFIFNFTTIENKKYEVALSESEIFGATNSGGFINRKHLFDIAGIGKIKAVDISLTWDEEEEGKGEFKLQNLVFELGINLDKLAVDGDRLEIYTNDALTYLTSVEKRTINTKWIYTNEDEKSVVYTHLNTTVPVGYEVRWYRAQKDSTDMYAGDGWTQIATNQEYPFRCILENLSRTSNEQIKLIILKLDTTTSTIIPIESNVLEFINETISETEELYDLRFNYGVGNSNVYALWNMSGILKDLTYANKKYKVDLNYKTAYSLEELNERLRQGVWRIPTSCLQFVTGDKYPEAVAQESGYWVLTRQYTKLDTVAIELTDDEKKTKEGEIITEQSILDSLLAAKKEKELKEHISPFFSIQYSPLIQYHLDSINDLSVEIYTIDESKVYELSTQLVFTKESDDGTGYSIDVWFVGANGIPTLTLQKNNTYNINVKVYDSNGEEIESKITLNIKELDSYGAQKTKSELFTLNKDQITIEVASGTTITYYYSSLIVIAEVIEKNENNTEVTLLKLKKEVPIALTTSGELKYSGPIEIVYDAAGKIKNFNNNSLAMLDSNFEELSGTWSLTAGEEGYQSKYFYPNLNKFTQNNRAVYKISPYEVFESSRKDSYGYALKWEGNEGVFYQPIIIRQATSFSPLIDDWDGKFKIDENTGTVMSSVMVAGNKNNGSFSGVILGEVQNSGTGILGYHEGSQSYGFLDDGTAFIGKSGAGRIEFNGNTGTIQSSKYDKTTRTGTLLDLDDGLLVTGNIEALSGYIGGAADTNAWKIGIGALTSSSGSGFIGLYSKDQNEITDIGNGKDKKDWRIIAGTKFGVDSSGNLYATNANITGTITATNGYIGGENGWEIETGKITSGDIGLYSTDQSATINNNPVTNLRIKAGDNFGVSSDGILYANKANITGIIHAGEGGTIGGWNIKAGALTSGGFGEMVDGYITPSIDFIGLYSKDQDEDILLGESENNGIPRSDWRILAGKKFGVSKEGILYAGEAYITGRINATSGSIGSSSNNKKILLGPQEINNYKTLLNSNTAILSSQNNQQVKVLPYGTDWDFSWWEKVSIGSAPGEIRTGTVRIEPPYSISKYKLPETFDFILQDITKDVLEYDYEWQVKISDGDQTVYEDKGWSSPTAFQRYQLKGDWFKYGGINFYISVKAGSREAVANQDVDFYGYNETEFYYLDDNNYPNFLVFDDGSLVTNYIDTYFIRIINPEDSSQTISLDYNTLRRIIRTQ